MTFKDLITVGFSLAALLLSLASFFRTRRIDRVSIRQSLTDKKYEALAKDEELQSRILQLLIRLAAIEQSSGSKEVASLKSTLNYSFQNGRQRSTTLTDLSLDGQANEMELLLRERIGLLSTQTAILAGVE